jgi:hypothetical protein
MGFFTGDKAKNYQQSTLLPSQEKGLNQLTDVAQGKEGGGVWGDLGAYYKDLMNPNGQNYQAMQAPEMRQFNEQIIPGLSEQFAGMGSGGLSSSGFRNAGVSAGTDLSERLGAMRAQLRQQGAAGLANIGQQSLGQYSENIHQPGTGGLLDYAAPVLGAAATAFGGPIAGAATSWLTNQATGMISNKGSTGAPQSSGGGSSKFGLPNFLNR